MNLVKIKPKPDMWVSNNRVLQGLSSVRKEPGRNPNFDPKETNLLISIWGDPKIQKALITSHRKNGVIARIAMKMAEYGYKRSPEEVNTRIRNLKCIYSRLKKDIEMGMGSKTTWKHFEAMDKIMNRMIFSVRPNEIPKPSLRYQLEMQLNEMEEKQFSSDELYSNQQQSEYLGGSESSIRISDVCSSNDARMHFDEIDMHWCEREENLDVNEGNIVSNGCNDDDVNGPLLIPKEETINLDSEEEYTDTQP